jgi:exonuclease SbcD
MMLQHSASLLANLQIFVITTAQKFQQPIEIKNSLGETCAICSPIPYLRDQDLMLYKQDENIVETKERLRNAIESYYIEAFHKAQQNNPKKVPIILTGHLVAHKGEMTESQSERPIHRQNFGELHTANLPSEISYVALGHLHKPQQINGGVLTRYAGSPIPLSFQEVNYHHSITIVEIIDNSIQTTQVSIPRFRMLLRISIRNFDEFEQLLQTSLDVEGTLSPTWIECECKDFIVTDSIKVELQTIAQNHNASILKFTHIFTEPNKQFADAIPTKDISSFTEMEIFVMALEQSKTNITEEDQKDLLNTFSEALGQFQEFHKEGK